MNQNIIDLRETGLLNPVKNQGQAGNCYAHALCLAVEFEYRKETGQDFVASAQDIHENLVESEEEDEEGKTLKDAFNWIKSNGCVSQNSCPYRATWRRLENPPPRQVITYFLIC
jgi:KDEL-tailed cysteine endopeptidase